jgi:phosphomannomutase
MHGVGYEFSVESFKSFNLKPFVPVLEQIEPNPEFPTVKFPNPEEGKSSLNLAIKTANESNSTIILANDPDADRLAVAEKNSTTGEWKIFNGI